MKKNQHLMFALTVRVVRVEKILRCNPEGAL